MPFNIIFLLYFFDRFFFSRAFERVATHVLLEIKYAKILSMSMFFVRPDFLRLLKSLKTDEDLQYSVEKSRSISM